MEISLSFIQNYIQIMSQTLSKKKQVFQKKIVFSSQIQKKENQVDHLITETPLMELNQEQSHKTEQLKSPTFAQESSTQEYYKIIDKSHSQSSDLVSKKCYSRVGYAEKLKKYGKKKSTPSLKSILKSMKVYKINRNFIQKLKLNNIHSFPIPETAIWAIQNCQEQQQQYYVQFLSLLNIWKVCYIIGIIGLFISLSFSIAFTQIYSNSIIDFFVVFAIIISTIQIIMNLKKIVPMLQQNSIRFLQGNKMILFQSTTQLVLLLNLTLFFTDHPFPYRQIILICCLTKVCKISSYSSFLMKYLMFFRIFHLLALLLSNLLFAHLIAIILNYMISDHESNWQVDKLIYEKEWPQRYIWSYYWAVTSIAKVSVQFTPKNAREAVWIIIIQILCFLILFYNISKIAILLGFRNNMAQQKESILQKMIYSEYFSQGLKCKIRQKIQPDYIQYCEKTRKQNQLLNDLPLELQKQISIERNLYLLSRSLSFLQESTIRQMASKMKKFRFYSRQIIKNYDDPHNIYILQNGTVSYTSKQGSWRNMIGNIITKNKKPFLLNWDFITMENMSFNIKAKTICTVGKLNFQDFLRPLKINNHDFQHYCFLRDKSKNILGQFETVGCNYCCNRHTAFTCHKMHYIPLKQMIIHRHLADLKRQKKIPRRNIQRISMRKTDTLKQLRANNCCYQSNRESYNNGNPRQNKYIEQQPYFQQFHDENCYSRDFSIMIRMLNQNVFPFFEKYDDYIWGIKTDACHNYRNYFPRNNIINLQRNIFYKQKAK